MKTLVAHIMKLNMMSFFLLSFHYESLVAAEFDVDSKCFLYFLGRSTLYLGGLRLAYNKKIQFSLQGSDFEDTYIAKLKSF